MKYHISIFHQIPEFESHQINQKLYLYTYTYIKIGIALQLSIPSK